MPTQIEWIGNRYQLSTGVREGDAFMRPQVILWLELPQNVIVGMKLIHPEQPATFGEALEEAMQRPAEGAPRRPARIRVPDEEMASELRGAAGDIPVTVDPVPELDFAFHLLSDSLAEAQ